MTKTLDRINIFIRQVNSPGKCCVAVDYADFPVIAVILMRGEGGLYRRKHLTAYTLFFQNLRIMVRKEHHTAHSVIHHPHFHPLGGFFFQDFQDFSPHLSPFNDEIFHKNKFPGIFKLLLEFRKHGIPERKISDRGILADRKTPAVFQINGQICPIPAHLF